MRFLRKNIGCLAHLALILMLFTDCTKKQETQPEIKAVWLHPGLFSLNEIKAVGQIDSLFNIYQDIGINNLFCYNTTSDENSFDWDYLDVLIKEGHKKGIKIHPIFYPGYNVNLEKELVDNPAWLIRDMEGKYQPHFNLANPDVRKNWVDKISATLKYDIDGIHLDYIRFPITQVYSYDSATCETFKMVYQYSPVEVSHDCGSWAKTGLIDFICPMLYTNNLDLFKEYLRNALNIAGEKCKVYPDIGVHTAHNDITKELIIKEVNITREEKTNGMVFFSGYSFNKEMRDTLKLSLFKQI